MADQWAGVPTLTVSVEPLDYEHGGWCRRCLLPSGVRIITMVTIGPSSHLRTFDVCGDCKSFAVDPPEAPDVDHL